MKQITYDQEAIKKIQAGVDKLANAVKTTLGPGGSNVIIDNPREPHITKDGVTVARAIALEDPIENLGAQVVKEAASRTAFFAGDGTTTATVLAQAILNQGIKNVAAGANRIDLKRGIDMATKAIVSEIKNMAKPVSGSKDIRNVALISANGDAEVANIIAEAIDKVTKDGLVIVEDSRNATSEVRVVEGVTFERGWLNAYFINNQEEMTCDFENPVILLIDYVIEEFVALLPILRQIQAKLPERPVLVIAEDVRGNALSTMAMNSVKGAIRIAAVQSPDFGDMRKESLKDIAALTGATIITKDAGLTTSNVDVTVCGTCERVRISQWKTTLFGGNGPYLNERINLIQTQMKDANDNALAKLKDRLARLTGRVGVIYVGGNSEVEVKEKNDRIDDALQATRAAIEEGIVPGGGVALVRCMDSYKQYGRPYGFADLTDDEMQGVEILFKSVLEPIRCIAENVGVNGDVVLNQMHVSRYDPIGYGFNAKTHKYEDLYQAGVIDPAKVTRLALENAASVSGMLLTTKAVITNAKAE
jgi:chaperonin GroEL